MERAALRHDGITNLVQLRTDGEDRITKLFSREAATECIATLRNGERLLNRIE